MCWAENINLFRRACVSCRGAGACGGGAPAPAFRPKAGAKARQSRRRRCPQCYPPGRPRPRKSFVIQAFTRSPRAARGLIAGTGARRAGRRRRAGPGRRRKTIDKFLLYPYKDWPLLPCGEQAGVTPQVIGLKVCPSHGSLRSIHLESPTFFLVTVFGILKSRCVRIVVRAAQVSRPDRTNQGSKDR